MPIKDPERYRASQRRLYQARREENVARAVQWAKDNPDCARANKRAAYLKLNYGLTLEEYEALAAGQGNACAICEREDWATPKGLLHVDHDHVTGEVRGLLCHHCNTGIGNLQDDEVILGRALEYLRRSRGGSN